MRTKDPENRDLGLEVEGKVLYICRQQLSIQSPVFKVMFGEKWGELQWNDKDVIKLEGETLKDFIPFLALIGNYMPPKVMMQHYNAGMLFQLRKYLVGHLKVSKIFVLHGLL